MPDNDHRLTDQYEMNDSITIEVCVNNNAGL